jgi:hypothetical protein
MAEDDAKNRHIIERIQYNYIELTMCNYVNRDMTFIFTFETIKGLSLFFNEKEIFSVFTRFPAKIKI